MTAAGTAAPTPSSSSSLKPATTLFKIPLLPHDSFRLVAPPPDPGGRLAPGGVLVVSANALHFVQVGLVG